jgi:hypothetical protein
MAGGSAQVLYPGGQAGYFRCTKRAGPDDPHDKVGSQESFTHIEKHPQAYLRAWQTTSSVGFRRPVGFKQQWVQET